MENDISIWFLLLSLFFPRLVLLFSWLSNNLPYNTTPFWADLMCSIFLPRILVLVYIYDIQGSSPWFFIHLIALFIAWGFNFIRLYPKMEKMMES
jgi:hypothetical protein